MKYQKITIEVPALTDEAAAYLHKFIEALMYAVDEYYYRQIHCYYSGKLDEMMVGAEYTVEELKDPPF
jgi:hypothetical protein